MDLQEVFRIEPVKEKYYYTAEYDVCHGHYPNQKYFTSKPLRYVGEFIQRTRIGAGDGQDVFDTFNDNGVINCVKYSYEGYTSFIEVDENPHPQINNTLHTDNKKCCHIS